MTSITTFYLSRILGNQIFDFTGKPFGKILDLLVTQDQNPTQTPTPVRPRVVGIKIKTKRQKKCLDFSKIELTKIQGQYIVRCLEFSELAETEIENGLFLVENVLDKQLVDINGRKVVRVNDIRLVKIPSGAFALAVDIGMEGLLRRIGIAKPIKRALSLFNLTLPAKFILWDEVEALDNSNLTIKLQKTHSKLSLLHPSDLADIIEDLGKTSQTSLFNSLDEEKAADVLEELETAHQIHIIESLSIEKAADVLEKMPADEVADILNELDEERVEMLLKEMQTDSSDEVRELLEYSENTVGSIMSTDFLAFHQNMTVDETLQILRKEKPETDAIYSLFVADVEERFISTVSLRDLVVSEPTLKLHEIMRKLPLSVFDTDKIDSLAEIVSKYNLLAIPVTDHSKKMCGVVVIDDIVDDLLTKRKTK